jgi:SAM-dependent methyltransferase
VTAELPSREEYLRRLLVAMWLRPESALWYAHECFAVRRALGAEPMTGPSLEFGCMEGLSSFVLLGGQFGLDFDMYADVSWRPATAPAPVAGGRPPDYFDQRPREEVVAIEARASSGFDVGLSWKAAHLEKARRFGVYGRMVEQDPNLPLAQFGDRSFTTIWAPNLYWVDQLPGLLGELRRILRPDGRIVTVLPDRSALDRSLMRHLEGADPQWLANLDRGRYANIARQARTEDQWRGLFEERGLVVSHHEPFLPSIVYAVNDVGLRPMFPVLMNIYEKLRGQSLETWREVKRHWLEVAGEYLTPLCRGDWVERASGTNVWHLFELKPAS